MTEIECVDQLDPNGNNRYDLDDSIKFNNVDEFRECAISDGIYMKCETEGYEEGWYKYVRKNDTDYYFRNENCGAELVSANWTAQ